MWGIARISAAAGEQRLPQGTQGLTGDFPLWSSVFPVVEFFGERITAWGRSNGADQRQMWGTARISAAAGELRLPQGTQGLTGAFSSVVLCVPCG